jgi:hypothetical protein
MYSTNVLDNFRSEVIPGQGYTLLKEINCFYNSDGVKIEELIYNHEETRDILRACVVLKALGFEKYARILREHERTIPRRVDLPEVP